MGNDAVDTKRKDLSTRLQDSPAIDRKAGGCTAPTPVSNLRLEMPCFDHDRQWGLSIMIPDPKNSLPLR